jgi:hypothetical protein
MLIAVKLRVHKVRNPSWTFENFSANIVHRGRQIRFLQVKEASRGGRCDLGFGRCGRSCHEGTGGFMKRAWAQNADNLSAILRNLQFLTCTNIAAQTDSL